MPPGPEADLPLVGRDKVLEVVDAWLASAAKGSSLCGIISGPVGIGKTRVLEETRARAKAKGFRVFQSQAEEGEEATYSLWMPPTRGRGRPAEDRDRADAPSGPATRRSRAPRPWNDAPLADDMGDGTGFATMALAGVRSGGHEGSLLLQGLPPVEAALRVTDHMELLLKEGPLLILLDDLQWADAGSLDVLGRLLRIMRERPVLVVVAVTIAESQTPEMVGEGGTEAVLATLAEETRVSRVHLAPLSDEHVLRVAEDVLGGKLVLSSSRLLPESLSKSKGNPSFLVELLRSGLQEGWIHEVDGRWEINDPPQEDRAPTTLRRVFGRRLSALGERDRELLEAAAIQGHQFELRGLEATLDSPVSLKEELEELSNRTGLLHPVSWWLWSFDHPILVDVLRTELPHDLAVELYARGADWMGREHSERSETVALMFLRAEQEANALPWLEAAWEEAEKDRDGPRMIRLAKSSVEAATKVSSPPDELASWHRREGLGWYVAGNMREAEAALRRGFAKSPPGRARVQIQCDIAMVLRGEGDRAGVESILVAAEKESVAPKDVLPVQALLAAQRLDLWSAFQEYGLMIREGGALLETCLQNGTPTEAVSALREMAFARLARSEIPQAREEMERALSLAELHRLDRLVPLIRGDLGGAASLSGDLSTAVAVYHEVIQHFTRTPGQLNNRLSMMANLAEVLYQQGEHPAALDICREVEALADRSGMSIHIIPVRCIMVASLLESGDILTAATALDLLLKDPQLEASIDVARFVHSVASQLYLAQGLTDLAEDEASRAGHDIEGQYGPAALRSRALVEAAQGEVQSATDLLQRVIQFCHVRGRRWEEARTLDALGDLQYRESDTLNSRRTLITARDLYQVCGAASRAHLVQKTIDALDNELGN